MAKVNCAIYTRKSTEEGLEQDFNSLDNQFESAKAYIESQKHENWKFYKRYDDGGFTGANTKRPGLTQLLEDIEKGFIQVVVVYKVDRLSRSLIDFSKMMELFEEKNVDFVSVTQHFNTSNSMGKLTLNVLLSFAQFEREVTGERIRDKIANSRKKGMWMGGNVPHGYKLENKKLYIESQEAQEIEYIFQSYLNCTSILELQKKLSKEGFTTRSGKPWLHGTLGKVLNNPTYIGKVKHKDKVFEGQQDACIDEVTWSKVQTKLKSQINRDTNSLVTGRYLLFKKLFNSDGEMYRCDASIKKNKDKKVKHEYYISNQKRFKTSSIDAPVLECIQKILCANNLFEQRELDELHKIDWNKLDYRLRRSLTQYLISKAIIDKDQIKLKIEREKIKHLQQWQSDSHNSETKEIIDAYFSVDNKYLNIVINFDKTKFQTSIHNKNVLWNIAKGIQYREWLESGMAITNIANRENKPASNIIRSLKMGYLNPKIVEKITNGKYPNITVSSLKECSKYTNWQKQELFLQSFN